MFNKDDGGTYRSSRGQKWLWSNWLDYWGKVSALAKNHGNAETWGVINGDMVDKNWKHKQSQSVSLNDADIFKMSIMTLEPMLDVCTRVFVVRGTAAHVGASAEMEEMIAYDIGAEPTGDNHSWWQLPLMVENVFFYLKHHGPLGRLKHTRGNALNRVAVEFMAEYANERCPDVSCQSHNHKFATSSDEYPIKVFATPAWQLKTEFVNRLGIFEPADIGGLAFICEGKEYTDKVYRYKEPRDRPWKISRRKT